MSETSATADARPLARAGHAPERTATVRADAPWLLLLAVLALTVSILGVVNAPTLSALDEHTHLDYAWKISHGEVPGIGVVLSPEILDEWSCRSQDNLEDVLPPCGERDPAAYPIAGENYNAWHPPLYYAVTGALARVIEWLPLDLTFTTAARLVGGLWLAAGMVGLYLVARLWRLPRWLAACGAALPAGIPLIVHASSTVTNDAPALLAGVGAAWVLTRVVVSRDTGVVVPVLVAVLTVSTKVMNSAAVLIVAGILMAWSVGRWRAGDRQVAGRVARLSAAVVVAVGVVALAWSMLQEARTPADWSNPIQGVNTVPVVGLPFDEWAPTLTAAFEIVTSFYLQPAVASVALVATVRVLGVLFTAAPIAGVAAIERGREERLVAWAALAGVVAVPLIVQGQEFLRAGAYFPGLSSRYALTIVPLAILTMTFVAHRNGWRVAPVAVPAISIVTLLLAFTGIV